MKVVINGNTVTIPSTLAEFTLGQRIAFQQQHGNLLDDMAKSIGEMEDSIDKEFEVMQYGIEKVLRTMSFFTNLDIEILRHSESFNNITNIYYASAALLFEEEENMTLQQEFIWKGETWKLHAPELKQGSDITAGELIDAKQMLQDMDKLSKSKWEAMLPLCAIFLRKEGEAYQESFLYDGSERLTLMQDLPMDIVLQVGFFFQALMNISIRHLKYSGKAGLNPVDVLLNSILQRGDGLISSNQLQ